MNKLAIASTIVTAGLAGCALAPDGDPSPTMAEVAAGAHHGAFHEDNQMTGSRLKGRDSTDRMLKAVGAQGARDEMNRAPRPLVSQ